MVRSNEHYEVLGFFDVKIDKASISEKSFREEADELDPFLLTDPFDVTYEIIWERSLLQQH